MSKRPCIFLLMILLLVGCRERTNQLDIEGDDFVLPPAIYLAAATTGYYDNSGSLIGVKIEVYFTEAFEKTLPVGHVFYQDVTEILRWGFAIERGTTSYAVDITSSNPFPVGNYCLKLLFGEIAMGACRFDVIEAGGRLTVKGVSVYEPSSNMSGDWHVPIDF